MISTSPDWIGAYARRLDAAPTLERTGRVAQVAGLLIESDGPHVRLGEVCEIRSPRHAMKVFAEVVGFREHRVLLMALGEMEGIHPGCEVLLSTRHNAIPGGEGLLGRVIDGLGNPIDGKGPLLSTGQAALRRQPPNPLTRRRIKAAFETGVKAIDCFCPVGCGQRLGIFAGSGVGKSTLLGMLARGSKGEVNVIALVGERGRELREFIEKDLGAEGLARSVIVVATSDQSAPVRLRAAYLATAIAEGFRDAGRDVLFLLDSVTRFAMAQREIGLAVGEPPASRGYTPSVFSALPRLLERTGNSDHGSITAFYTVLVEGDDLNEPIADSVRGILDGHLVLSRALATANQFPAVDVLESVSRLSQDICTPEEWSVTSEARDLLALYRKNEDLITLGAYNRGANARVDRSIEISERLRGFLRQRSDGLIGRRESLRALAELLR